MAIAHQQTQSTRDGSSTTSFTLSSYAVGSGSDRTLVACVQWRDDTTSGDGAPGVSSIVFNSSENFTARAKGSYNPFGDTYFTAEIWTLDNPTNTTANVVLTLQHAPDANDWLSFVVMEYTGANNGVGTNTGSASGTDTTIAITFTTDASDSIQVMSALSQGGGDASATSDETERYDDYASAGDDHYVFEAPTAGASDTISIGYGTSRRYSACAIELLAAGGASPVNITLDTAQAQADGQNITVVPGAVSVALDTAQAQADGQNVTIVPGEAIVSLSTAQAQADGQNVTIVPGAATVGLNTAQAQADGQAITIVPGAVSIALSTAQAQADGQAISVVPGAASVSLSTAQAQADGQNISIVRAGVIDLNTAQAQADGQAITIVPGAVSVSLNTAQAQADGQAISVVPGAVSVGLKTAGIYATAQPISVIREVLIDLATAQLAANGINIAIVEGEVPETGNQVLYWYLFFDRRGKNK